MYIPQDIILYIESFLKKCEYCNKLKCKNQIRECAFCKRCWCHPCYTTHRLIEYSYFEVYVMTCKNCLRKYRTPTMY